MRMEAKKFKIVLKAWTRVLSSKSKEGRPANICSSCISGGSLMNSWKFSFSTVSNSDFHILCLLSDFFPQNVVTCKISWSVFSEHIMQLLLYCLETNLESSVIVVLHCFRLFLYKLLKCQSMQGSHFECTFLKSCSITSSDFSRWVFSTCNRMASFTSASKYFYWEKLLFWQNVLDHVLSCIFQVFYKHQVESQNVY